jgi:hypothetical protein
MPIPDALDAFPGTRPVLTQVEIDRARPNGRVRQVEVGEVLYRPGEVGRPCFILLSASLEIGEGATSVSSVHRALAESELWRSGPGVGVIRPTWIASGLLVTRLPPTTRAESRDVVLRTFSTVSCPGFSPGVDLLSRRHGVAIKCLR